MLTRSVDYISFLAGHRSGGEIEQFITESIRMRPVSQ